jgi:hypothetical protein
LKGDRVFKKNALNQAIEEEQLRLFSEVSGLDPDSPEFASHIDHIIKIDSVKTKKPLVSSEAWIKAGASILGILLVLNYERTGAIVSKSFGLAPKP